MVELTPEQEQRVRAVVDTVEVPSGSTKQPLLHIPTSACRVCRSDGVDMQQKDVEVFPVGYREWCPECLDDAPVDIEVDREDPGVEGDLG